jgi:hypothetical protein
VWFAPEQGRQEPADTARAGDVAAATDGPAAPPADAHAAEIGGSSGTVIDLGKLSFKRDITRARRSHLEEWLQYAADTDGVQKSDFEEWWNSDRTGETGYNAGSFWEAFAKAAMKQSDQFAKPNARTYRYTGAGLEGS